ncbi:DHA2 family efflux MFS transporter permease subunit [Sphingomonas crusticola]|uniref:DHA2 family efflux MFS transporter permease subunit n=1 Tax=Sphingomonas crusticola TaxID=1697973 RepID=UPI00196836B8|nr:DHA2 family efflux MFS transporter permease subunit [Sphingomonas crusticola]
MAANPAPSRDGCALSGPTMWLAGGVLALSNFMVVLDTSIANVSVPHIAGSLAISPDQGTWVITSYSVAEAICVPLTGWLAMRFGTVKVYLAAMAGFGLFSILCGMSPTLGALVAARIGQGICGGPIMPLTQTLLLRVFPSEKRGQAMGLWAMTTVVAPIAGPVLGGTISDNWSWHWIFFINIPIAITCVVGSYMLVRRCETAQVRARIDAGGMALLVLWVGALQIMLDLGRDRDWFHSTFIVALACIAAVGFVTFLIWELTQDNPAVDLRVFRHRGFSASVIALAVTYGTFFSAVVVTPQWLQGAMGYTAQWSGYVTAWQGLLAVVFSLIVGKLSGKFDPRLLVSFGMCWMAGSIFVRSGWTSSTDYWTLALPHLAMGLGMPFFFVPLTILSLGSVQPKETASAAGLSSFMRTLSGAVGTSVATTIWANGAVRTHAELVGSINPSPGLVAQLESSGYSPAQVRAMVENLLTQESLVISLDHMFEIATALLLLSAALIWLVPKPRKAVDTSQAH